MPRSTDAHRRSHSPRPTLGRRARRAVAAVLTIALASVGLTATAQQAQAVTVTPMTTSYNGVVNGDFTTAGNGVLGCTGTAFSGSMTCNDLHNGSGTAGAYNDFFAMANVKQAAGFEAYSNSSTATITVPAGSTVKKAVLYWSGNTGAVAGYTGARCGTNSYSTATIPDTTAGYTSRSLKMRIGTGAIQDVPTTASRTHTENLSTQLTSGQPQYYSSSSDVTALFENAGVSGSVPISVGNIWAANGAACYAGWSLAVVYDFGSYDAANPLTTARNVLLYDGHVRKQSNEAADTVRFSGFTALTNQARIGMTLYEGDRAITGDYAQYRTSKNSTSVRIPNSQSSDTGAGGATDNIGVSHALGNQRYQGTGTGRFFNASVDVLERTVAMGGIGATSLDLDLGTTGDSYLLQNTAFSVPTGRVVIDKSFNGTADTQTLLPGEAGTFTITVTNTGGVPLRNLTVTDPLAGDCARPVPGVLGQNDSYRYTCTAPVRAGAYTNTASVVGTVDGYETQQVQDTDTTRVNSAIIDIDKSAALDDRAIAGDTATYTFALTNTGSVTLDQVAVTDPLAGLGPISYTWPGTANRLQPGQTATGTASYTLTQADIDRGYLDNTATVTGRESGGKQPSDADSNRLPIAQASAIDVVKSGVLADPAGDVAAGDLVDYTFTISNPGNTTITDVALSDALAGLGPVTIDWPGADGVLAPGQNAVATASYPLTQADLNAGRVTNSATATGTGPGGAPLTDTSDFVLPVPPEPGIDAAKTGGLPSGALGVPGEVMTFTLTGTNTGNLTLTGVTLEDSLDGVVVDDYQWPGEPGVLDPGQIVTATASYTLTQQDVDRGSVDNAVTATGNPPTGPPQTSTDTITAPVPQTPAIALDKQAAFDDSVEAEPGQPVDYTLTATNTGNVTLSGVTITDPKSGLSAIDIAWPDPSRPGVLAPGEKAVGTASYPLTQADLDAGYVGNEATATGTGPGDVEVSDSDDALVGVLQDAAIHLSKSVEADARPAVGDEIRFDFAVTNTGNVTLSGTRLSDPLVGLGPITFGEWPSGTAGVLAPGQTVTASAPYTVTQADLDNGMVSNTGTVRAASPTGDPVTDTGSATAEFDTEPSIAVSKSGALADGATGRPGDTVEYRFEISNTGDVTLSGVALDDPLEGLSDVVFGDWPGDAGVLAPGTSVTATASYTLTQADVDRGSVDNTATASGTTPPGESVSAEDSETVAIDGSARLRLDKTSTAGLSDPAAVGDVIEYAFLVENTGTRTVSDVAIDDELDGLSALVFGDWPGDEGVLAPGASVTATASYTLTQADLDRGGVTNVAVATGTAPGGDPAEPGEDSVTDPIDGSPSIVLDKTGPATAPDGTAAGDTVQYRLEARNDGNQTLTDVRLVDERAGELSDVVWSSGTAGTLEVGGTVTATATVTLTQADVDAGQVVNTATVTGTGPQGAEVDAEDAVTTTIPSAPSISIVKDGALADPDATPVRAGAVVDYRFTIENTGTVSLSDVSVTDELLEGTTISYDWSGAASEGTLAPGETITATASYAITQAQLDAGEVVNTASVSGTPPSGDPVGDEDGATVELAPQAGIALTKTGSFAPIDGDRELYAAGDTVEYLFTIENTGNVTLDGVAVTDPRLGDDPRISYDWSSTGEGRLAPGEIVTATAEYTLTQADIDAGVVRNTATVSGDAPQGGSVTDEADDELTIPAGPALQVVKSATVPEGAAAGDEVAYRFVVTNIGNVTLGAVDVSDELPGLGALVYDWSDAEAEGTLAPQQSVAATASYTLTQADLDAGRVQNTATAQGTPPTGDPVGDEDTVVTPLPASPSIGVEKSGVRAGEGAPAAGDVVDYRFVVTNTGNVTLSDVALDDPRLNGAEVVFQWRDDQSAGVLVPGDSVTASAEYVLTQADVDAGVVENTATGSGTPPTGDPVTGEGEETTPLPASPSIGVEKSGVRAGEGAPAAGDVVDYRFVVTNTGNVTLSDVALDDPRLNGAEVVFQWRDDQSAGVLVPGDSVTASAEYVLTQADVDAGVVENTATGSGTPPTGDPVTGEGEETTPLPADPGLSVTKIGTLDPDAEVRAGAVLNYTFHVANTGNVTLSDVALDDPRLNGAEVVFQWRDDQSAGVLVPGDSVTASAEYVLTQADVDAGVVENTATGSGTPPTGDPVTGEGEETTPLPADPGLTLEKDGELSADARAGERVDYRFTVANTGNVTLTGITLSDVLDITGLAFDWDATELQTPGTLTPGDRVTATAAYTLTQADVDAGTILNSATASGTPPAGDPVTDGDDATVPLPADPSIEIVKTGLFDAGFTGVPGDTVSYGFEVRNTGNVTLSGVVIADPLPGLGEIVVDGWPGDAGVLAPGQSVTATAPYTLTAADVDRGEVLNTATASGTPPTGDPVTGGDDETMTIPSEPAIQLDKSGVLTPGDGPAQAGTVVEYSFTLTNIGNVTLGDVTLADELEGLRDLTLTWTDEQTAGTLARGGQVTGTASYALTQADIDAGVVTNLATATGTPPRGADPVSDEDTVDVPVPRESQLELVKTASAPDGELRAGDEVRFEFRVTNTGNTTVSDVVIDDPLPGLGEIAYDWSGAAGEGVLRPGEVLLASAGYTLTQADVDRGSVANSATVTGDTPDGGDPGDDDGTELPIPAAPAIALDKSGELPGGAAASAGDTVEYSFELSNTGNVTLHGVAVSDPLPGLGAISVAEWPGESGVLAPGQTVTARADYTLTQADVDRGSVANTATASGTPPDGGDPVTDVDEVLVEIEPAPAIEVVKDSSLEPGATGVAGETIRYDFLVRNTGTVTVDDVRLSDPLPGLSAIEFGSWPGETGVLAPGQLVAATASYTITQDDVDRGSVENTATGTGTTPGGDTVEDEGSTTTPLLQDSALQLVKSGSIDESAPTVAGDVVRFTFEVSNVGTTTVSGVVITDPLPGLGAITVAEWPGAPGVLAPGQSVLATADYTLTQADVDRGSVENTATVTGTPPGGSPVGGEDGTTVPLRPVSGVEVAKSAAVVGGGAAALDSTIEYTITVVNTGGTTLTGVVVDDPLPGLGALRLVWPGEAGTLAPGQTVTATADYRVTQADVDAGQVANTATVTATPPVGPTVTGGDTVTVDVPGPLPSTGAESAVALAVLAALLLAAGVLVVTRRRRSAPVVGTAGSED